MVKYPINVISIILNIFPAKNKNFCLRRKVKNNKTNILPKPTALGRSIWVQYLQG